MAERRARSRLNQLLRAHASINPRTSSALRPSATAR
jgi:hypothetical protein